MSIRERSKFLSYVLRHKPDEFGLTLAEGGWVSIDALMKACNFTKEELDGLLLRMKRSDTLMMVKETLGLTKDTQQMLI